MSPKSMRRDGLFLVRPCHRGRAPGRRGDYLVAVSLSGTFRVSYWTVLTALAVAANAQAADYPLDLSKLAPVSGDNGASYYQLRKDDQGDYIHAEYRPGMKAVRFALPFPEAARAGHHVLSWRWRALALPTGGDECAPGKGDSAASIYIGWQRMARWYGLKYSWSAVGTRGAICDSQRNPFLVGDDIILETGGPLNRWITEQVDLEAEFRKYIGGGNPKTEIPGLTGIALLTDGDQTHSASSADFGSFVLHVTP